MAVCGSRTGRISAPSSASFAMAASTAERTAPSSSGGMYSSGTPILTPSREPPVGVGSKGGRSRLVESHGSWPESAVSASSRSATLRASGLTWSSDDPKAISP